VLKRVGNCLVLLFGVVDLVLFLCFAGGLRICFFFDRRSLDSFGLVAESGRSGFLEYV
jgi:hypothetical protein